MLKTMMKPQKGMRPWLPKVSEMMGKPRKVALLKMKANWEA
jgi:hypothetical protein